MVKQERRVKSLPSLSTPLSEDLVKTIRQSQDADLQLLSCSSGGPGAAVSAGCSSFLGSAVAVFAADCSGVCGEQIVPELPSTHIFTGRVF